jgi:hypothetical protein
MITFAKAFGALVAIVIDCAIQKNLLKRSILFAYHCPMVRKLIVITGALLIFQLTQAHRHYKVFC